MILLILPDPGDQKSPTDREEDNVMSNYKMDFTAGDASFVDFTGTPPRDNHYWSPILIKSAQIDAEIERLANLPKPANGRRSSIVAHPDAPKDIPSLAPGIRVTIDVLLPGERTEPFRHNATEVNFCIRGGGYTEIGGRQIRFAQYDVWNHPSYTTYVHVNDTDEIQVRFTYSNAPLLEKLQVRIWDDGAVSTEAPVAEEAELSDEDRKKRNSPFGTFALGDDGAMLMPYERLINPPSVDSPILYWPWKDVETELERLESLGQDYVGRRLYLLYNQMTGRTNGTTPNFFATFTIRPAGIVDRPHRHVSAAINYYFRGSGRSTVAGNTYEWEAGDLMLSAPGWAVHNHASKDERVYELTIQDQPLHIMMESLLWQESMKEPPALLGAQPGFATNRALEDA